MGQKPTIQSIDSIKKCKQDSNILSLQEIDYALVVKANECSTFLSRSGLLAQGEYWNRKSDKRNAVVTLRDPKTGKVKGGGSVFFHAFVAFFVNTCLFNTLGRAVTANKINVHSVICFLYKEKQFLGVSGDGDWFEVFDLCKLKENEFLGK